MATRLLSPSFGGPAIVLGLIVAVCGFAWAFRRSYAKQGRAGGPAPVADVRWWPLLVLAAIVVVALVIRLAGLDAKGLSHPEIYIPGLDLPAGSEPPPRHDFFPALYWHFFFETHPFGYYMAMLAWTKLFGATVVTIRLPEAILGALSIPLIYHIGKLLFGTLTGLIAAAMLALHGFHIFWSQSARMYAPGGLLGLLATVLLLEYVQRPQQRKWLGPAYALTVVACAMTVEFAWAVLAMHAIWAILDKSRARLLIPVIAITALAAMPMMSQEVVAARTDKAPRPTLAFLEDYFSFGFLLQHGAYPDSMPIPGPSRWFQLAAFCVSLPLLLLGIHRTLVAPREVAAVAPAEAVVDLSVLDLIPLALGAWFVMLGVALMTNRHRGVMFAVTILPLLALAVPKVAAIASDLIARFLPRFGWERGPVLMPLLALLPPIGIFIVSFEVPLTAPRAFVIFAPYFLILTAAGADVLFANRVMAVVVGAALLAIFVPSIPLAKRMPTSPRDYKGFAEAIHAHMVPDDTILVRIHNWRYTPLLYYLRHDRMALHVPDPRTPRVGAGCIWRIYFDGDLYFDAKSPELSAYHQTAEVKALRSNAWRFCPN